MITFKDIIDARVSLKEALKTIPMSTGRITHFIYPERKVVATTVYVFDSIKWHVCDANYPHESHTTCGETIKGERLIACGYSFDEARESVRKNGFDTSQSQCEVCAAYQKKG